MNQTDVAATIREFIRDTFFVEDFGEEDSFLQNGLIDSTGMLELVTFVEGRFELELAETELIPSNLDSVANLVAFIDLKRATDSSRS